MSKDLNGQFVVTVGMARRAGAGAALRTRRGAALPRNLLPPPRRERKQCLVRAHRE